MEIEKDISEEKVDQNEEDEEEEDETAEHALNVIINYEKLVLKSNSSS